MLEHHTNHTVVVEHGIALWLFHRLFERRTGAALESVLMDKVAATNKVGIIKIVLQPYVLHVNLAIGVPHINLTLPLAIGKAYTYAHVGNCHAAFKHVVLMLRVDVGCIHQYAARRLNRKFGFVLSRGCDCHRQRHRDHHNCF